MPVCWVGVGFSAFVFVMGVSQFKTAPTTHQGACGAATFRIFSSPREVPPLILTNPLIDHYATSTFFPPFKNPGSAPVLVSLDTIYKLFHV